MGEPSGDTELYRPAGHVRMAKTGNVERINSHLRFSVNDRLTQNNEFERFPSFLQRTNGIRVALVRLPRFPLTFRRNGTQLGPIDRQ